MRSILRSVSNASKLSTGSSEASITCSEPQTPPATPPRRPSRSADMLEPCIVPRRVRFDSRPLAPPPPLRDDPTGGAKTQRHHSPLLPEGAPVKGAPRRIDLPGQAYFIGDAAQNEVTGTGVIIYANQDRYEGDVVDGFAHGLGVYTHAISQASFRGRFEAGRQAQGMQCLEKGYTFDGAFANNAAFGPGTLFDTRGFVLRAPFVDGQPHGPGHAVFRSGDSFTGAFSYGRLGPGPGVVRYADGRVALRIVHKGVACLQVVGQQLDAAWQHVLALQETLLAQEQWVQLQAVHVDMQRLARRSTAGLETGFTWLLLPWQPNEAGIDALATLSSVLGDAPGPGQHAMRELVRGLLHLLGPARPYTTVGEVEGATRYLPNRAYPNLLSFVVDTVLPHYGSSNLLLGQAPSAQEALLPFAYRLDGERGYARRLEQAVWQVVTGLVAAFVQDSAGDDAQCTKSRMVLCSILDGGRRFDSRLHALQHTMWRLEIPGALPPAFGQGVEADNPIGYESRPPTVVAHVERGCSIRRTRAQRQGTGTGGFRARARTPGAGSLGSAGSLSDILEQGTALISAEATQTPGPAQEAAL